MLYIRAMDLLFATNNSHKLSEAKRILPEGIRLLSLEDFDFAEDIPETRDTLAGNAIQKAQFIHDRFGVNVFADDTGLEVSSP